MEDEMSVDSQPQQPLLTDLTSEQALGMGDSYFVDENYEDAVEAYACALSLFRDSEVVLQVRTLSHRSAAFYKLRRYQEALEDAELSLVLLSKRKIAGLRKGEGEICHYRAGLAAFELEKYQSAAANFEKASQLASLNKRDARKAIYEDMIEKCKFALSSSSTAAPPVAKKAPPKDTKPAAKPSAPKKLPVQEKPPALAGKKGDVPKYQYYQNDKVMTISVLETGVRQEDLTVEFEPKHLLVMLRKNGTEFTVVAGHLYAEIDVEKSKVVIKDEKVLVKLRKVEQYEWHELMGKADENAPTKNKTEETSSSSTTTPTEKEIPTVKDSNKPRPYVSHRDWDKIERNIAQEEKNEKVEGDEAMNKLFKQIYAGASAETQRAMVKSFQTSGGTVLSTNWDEVKDKDYEKERTAPKGVEWKTWDGEKVPMKEDD